MQKISLSDGYRSRDVEYIVENDDVFVEINSLSQAFLAMAEGKKISTKEVEGKVVGSINDFMFHLIKLSPRISDAESRRVLVIQIGACRMLLGKIYSKDRFKEALSGR